jgi:hypothetical protein
MIRNKANTSTAYRQANVKPKNKWHKMTFKNNQYGHGPYNPDIGAPIDLTAALRLRPTD